MPVLDIASSQPCSCFRNNVLAFRSETVFRNKLVAGNDRKLASSFSWKTFYLAEKKGRRFALGKAEFWRGRMMIKAISTLEITSIPCKKEGVNGYRDVLMRDVNSVKSNSPDFEPQSSSEVSTEVDEREKLRRMRISKANKGNTPWNKGRKHSPETLQRIKERTRLAMQDPKVKMKLVNLGHTQSDETRVKIGVGVRLGWERRRKKLMLQDTCLFEWQDLIAGAARRGLLGEEELQWDSYKILDSQLKEEWLQSIEQRKNTPRPKGSKRAPKSAEQKRKISEAIAAKWADPDYRSRVCSGLAKFHGIPEGVVRKPRKKPAGDGETQKRSFRKKDESNDVAKCKANIVNQLIISKRNRTPSYRDPLASTKLEMLKNIRAQRSAAINKKSEAITRAKLLIAEAEKAANALEIAANTSPIAQASLTESRTLIAEATRLIESIESEDATTSFENAVTRLIESIESEDETTSFENENDPSESSTLPLNMHKMMNGDAQNQDDRNVNGFHSISTSFMDSTGNFSFNRFMLPDVADMVNGDSPRFCLDDAHKTEEKPLQASSNGALDYSNSTKNHADPKLNPGGITVNGLEIKSVNQQELKKQVKMIKKWVRGRLVEVTEEA